MEAEQPQFATCRSLLRAGPAASLRMNIRAVNADLCEVVYQFSICCRIWCSVSDMNLQVAQYADEVGNNKVASNEVDQCLR